MKKIKIEIKWAIIFTIMVLVWMFMEKLAGLHSDHIDKHPIYTNFIFIPSIVIYILALLDKRKNVYNGIMTYKQGLISGLVITLIVTILSPLNQYITSTMITPDYFSNAIEYVVSESKMNQIEAENYFSLKNYTIQALIGAPIVGTVTTAIVAIFTRRENQP